MSRFALLLLGFCLQLVLFLQLPGYAADSFSFGSVKVGHSHLFMVTESPKGVEASQRAQDINEVIEDILTDKNLDPHRIDTVIGGGGNPSVVLDDKVIVVVGDKDQKIFGTAKHKLADKWASILRSRLT